ncbi:MAG: phosphoribosyl-ATP diphosphatase [Actinobacteria bacterium]|nr:phosphoribosyl-ATP diphosphatase [Actinomycetota bacterium]
MDHGLAALETVVRQRLADAPSGSYTAELLADDELIQRKIMEEAFEVCLELARTPTTHDRVVSEAADLVYHLLVGLVGAGVSFADVVAELDRRRR